MSLSGKEYEKMTKRASPPSPKLMNLLKAFLIGGLICAIGEGFSMLYESLGTGANMFKVAGPVIVYGSAAAVVYGVIYYIALRIMG